MAEHTYRENMRIKTIDFGKRVVAIVHVWLTRYSFVSITRKILIFFFTSLIFFFF